MKSISQAVRDWVMRDRDRDYLASLEAPDFGVARADALDLLNGRSDTRERLLTMAARFGLSPEDIDRDRQTSVDIARACGRCRTEKICRDYLAGKRDLSPCGFCPNAEKYAELARA